MQIIKLISQSKTSLALTLSQAWINADFIIIKAEELYRYEDYHRFSASCKTGCKNYAGKWSCPPFSPTFRTAFTGYEHALLFLMYTDPAQFDYAAPDFSIVKEANAALESLAEPVLRGLEQHTTGVSLLNGSCSLCESCACIAQEPCRNAANRRYSMQATGLDVTRICTDFFNHELLWYDAKTIPEYTSIVSCFLTNVEIDHEEIGSFLKKNYGEFII